MKAMRRAVIVILAVGAFVLLTLGATVQVSEAEYVIVEHFGDPRRVEDEAGLHFKWPPPIDTVIRIDRRLMVLYPDPSEYLTSDKKNVLVSPVMLWAVEDPVRTRLFRPSSAMVGAAVPLSDMFSSGPRLKPLYRVELTPLCSML